MRPRPQLDIEGAPPSSRSTPPRRSWPTSPPRPYTSPEADTLNESAKNSKSSTSRRRVSSFTITKKCTKIAIVLSKLSSPSRVRQRRRQCAPVAEPVHGDSAAGGHAASFWRCDPEDPSPPPYHLRVTNPAPGLEGEGVTLRPAAIATAAIAADASSSRFTIASIEAVRAPDSPVPEFPSPKVSTECVFGSTQSIAAVSGTVPGRCTRRGTTTPMLRRRDTIIFACRTTAS